MKIIKVIVCTTILSFLMLISIKLLAQDNTNTSVNYSYDANGNRVHRWVIMKKIKTDSTDTIHLDSLLNNDIVTSKKSNHTVTLYPNPTQGLLYLNITNLSEGETVEYIFVSLTGQELLRRKSGSPLTQIDIGNFASGIYIVNVLLGKHMETWKIVKQ